MPSSNSRTGSGGGGSVGGGPGSASNGGRGDYKDSRGVLACGLEDGGIHDLAAVSELVSTGQDYPSGHTLTFHAAAPSLRRLA